MSRMESEGISMDNTASAQRDIQVYLLGSKGEAVALIQAALREKGFTSLEITGRFCEETAKAVESFQRTSGLKADGTVGIETWKRLFDQGEDRAFAFENVLERELFEINLSRRMRLNNNRDVSGDGDVITRSHDAQLLGLALSGGGIRSATFNLGVLQTLAELKLLRTIDYLSTVSGGGYIGSWLTAWIRREGSIRKVEHALSPGPSDHAGDRQPASCRTPGGEEPAPIKFLRSFSNYITPKTGIFSADTWSVASTYTRNLTLNLTILITGFICLLLGPRLLVWGIYDYLWDPGRGIISSPWKVLVAALLLLLICVGFIAWNMDRQERYPNTVYPANARQIRVQITIVLPAVIAGVLIANLLGDQTELLKAGPLIWALVGSAAYFAIWILGWGMGQVIGRLPGGLPTNDRAAEEPEDDPGSATVCGVGPKTRMRTTVIASALFVGAIGGLLFRGLGCLFVEWKASRFLAEYLAFILSWGPPIIILLFSLIVTFHIGLMGRRFSEKLQEWWSRLGGWLLIVCLVWTFWVGIAIYGPTVAEWILNNDWSKYGLTSGWLLATLAGVLAGKSAATGAPGSSTRLDLIAGIAPYVFVIGLFLAMSQLTHVTLDSWMLYVQENQEGVKYADAHFNKVARYLYFMIWTGKTNPTLLLLLSCAVLLVLFAWRVDINQFSMHLLYRNRLVRCYLGASAGKRNPQPFTGFDAGDDLALSELALTSWAPDEVRYCGPYLISNAALNLVAGEELAWQERKGASFVLTPRFCGYELPAVDRGGAKECFRSTDVYAADDGGISLGTAMAISGAAVSPNMGYHSSPPLAFLLTVFNIRLGWWLGNPRGEKSDFAGQPGEKRGNDASNGRRRTLISCALAPPWRLAGPRFGLFCMLAELFGMTSDKSRYVYLSDGGHFDNLGLYELVRRRCRYIIVCDAGQDSNLSCDDLGNAIRKCRADFGIEIEIDVTPIRVRQEKKHSQRHCAVGTIHYERVDKGATPGTLIYLKASLTGDESTDILNYGSREATFPHQSTADQWFDESQFESYRKLGRHIAETTFGEPVAMVVEKQKRWNAIVSKRSVNSETTNGDSVAEVDETSVPHHEALFQALRQYWYPPSSAVQASFTKHGEALEEIFERIRKDGDLKFLDSQIYPEWGKLTKNAKPSAQSRSWLPESFEELRAGFYLCNSMIQLMENVYLDLRLEHEYDHPDTRGWMNLFRHWSWSGMFRATWAVCACTCGARFQDFCTRRLGLTVGKAEVRPLERQRGDRQLSVVELANEARENQCLNFLEAELIADFCRENSSLEDELTLWIMETVVHDTEKSAHHAVRDASSCLTFTFGFALVDARCRIVYFRVQDHLRKMGLARQGMKKMMQQAIQAGGQLDIALCKMPLTAREVPGDADKQWIQQLHKSLTYEIEGWKRRSEVKP